jgi:hypothetical protein
MPEQVKVFGHRVKRGQLGMRPITGMGFVPSEFPEDGFVFSLNIPSVPVFVSDSDLKNLKNTSNTQEIKSWKQDKLDKLNKG